MVLTQDGKVFPIHTGLDHTVDRLQEVIAVRLDMKSDQVRS